jgi:hypothetical protein
MPNLETTARINFGILYRISDRPKGNLLPDYLSALGMLMACEGIEHLKAVSYEHIVFIEGWPLHPMYMSTMAPNRTTAATTPQRILVFCLYLRGFAMTLINRSSSDSL